VIGHAQLPETQADMLAGQTVPQAPQFIGSVCVLVQALSQATSPDAQVEHAPIEQI
jgi:hypothetical protein